MKTILITGGNGQVGRALAAAHSADGWRVVALGRDGLDLADADAIARVVAAGNHGQRWAAVSNTGATDWAAFATEICRQSALRGGPAATVERIVTADYPTPARRPANSLLGHASLGHWGITPRPWQEALGDILDSRIGPVR